MLRKHKHMKTTTLFLLTIFMGIHAFPQTVIITDDPNYTEGEPSAVLDIKSDAGGLLLPRMTEAERTAIVSPAAGLLVYQYDGQSGFYYNAGTDEQPAWERLGVSGDTGGSDGLGQVWDVDGHVYPTRIIGDDEWMLENLRVTHFRNGEPIPAVQDAPDWIGDQSGARVPYDKQEDFADIFGQLYNWHAIAHPAGICPDGWDIPSESQWQALAGHLGGTAIAGAAMKAARHWDDPGGQATNSAGFSALPAGIRAGDSGQFLWLGYQSWWWTAPAPGKTQATAVALMAGDEQMLVQPREQADGLSVRCVRQVSQ